MTAGRVCKGTGSESSWGPQAGLSRAAGHSQVWISLYCHTREFRLHPLGSREPQQVPGQELGSLWGWPMSWQARAASQAYSAQPDSSPCPEAPPTQCTDAESGDREGGQSTRGAEEPHPRPSPGSGLSCGSSPRSTSGGEAKDPLTGLSSRAGRALSPNRAQDRSRCSVNVEYRHHRKDRLTTSAWVPEDSAPSVFPGTNLGPHLRPTSCLALSHQPTCNHCPGSKSCVTLGKPPPLSKPVSSSPNLN